MDIEKTKVMRPLVQPSTVQIMIYQNKSEECWILKNVCVKLNLGCHRKSGIQREEESFRQQIGLKFKDQTSEMQHLEHSWSLDASGNRSEVPRNFFNVVLEKDGEDQLDWSCEKWTFT
jgi:hypothetical protein